MTDIAPIFYALLQEAMHDQLACRRRIGCVPLL